MAHPQIKLVAIDLDGTLMNSQHQLSAENEAALRELLAQGCQIMLATGKTRHSAVPIIQKLGLTTPGVFMQGLLIVGADGETLYERTLENELAHEVAELAETWSCSMVGYANNGLITNVRDAFTDVFIHYHEPTPIAYGTWTAALAHTAVNKYIMVNPPKRIDEIRPWLEERIHGRATIVQALPNMVEILPPGASKGDGVARALALLDIPPSQMLAIGDGENDVEMLQMAAIGVAMGNGMAQAKAVADFITATNDENGVAQALRRFVLH